MSFFVDLISSPYNAATGKLTSWQESSLTDAEKAQVYTVSDNAAQYYGADSSTALIAQQTADEQAAQAGTDTSTLVKLATADKGSCPDGGLNLNGIGFGCISSVDDFLSQLNTLTHIGLGIVAVLILGWLAVTFGPTVLAIDGRRRS